MFTWRKIDRALAEERSSVIREELYALLRKGQSFQDEARLLELADQLCMVYCEVCDTQGFERTPVLVRTVYGKIARIMKIKISSIIADLKSDQKRRGSLKGTQAQKTHLRSICQRLSGALRSKATIRVNELAYVKSEGEQTCGFVGTNDDSDLCDERQSSHPILNSWTVNRKLAKLEENYKLAWAKDCLSAKTLISSGPENLKTVRRTAQGRLRRRDRVGSF